jgi:hypothetical protein
MEIFATKNESFSTFTKLSEVYSNFIIKVLIWDDWTIHLPRSSNKPVVLSARQPVKGLACWKMIRYQLFKNLRYDDGL